MPSILVNDTLSLLLGLNTVLIVVDAAIGYHVAPILICRGDVDEGVADGAVRGVRRLLAFMVALYMFFSCLAYSHQNQSYLTVVTIVVLLDIALLLILRSRFKATSDQ